MSTAGKVLIFGGVLNLAVAALLGFAIVAVRTKGAATTPRYLLAAHIGTLLHAAVLLGLVSAVRLSTLGANWQSLAAWLIVVSSALVAAKDTLNWLIGVQDEFREKAKTAALGGLAALGESIGIGILVVGVVQAT
jgi:hypothetical protein